MASVMNVVAGSLALAVAIAKFVLNAMSGSGKYPFPADQRNVSDTFYLEIAPAGWAFSIWGLIYTFNAAYIIYSLTTLFRPCPAVFTTEFYVVYILGDATNIAWLFAFSNKEIGLSLAVLIANQVGLYALLVVVLRNYQSNKNDIEKNHRKDAWALRILAQNGIMINSAWVTIATLLNLAMVITYDWGASLSVSCNLVLAILLVEVVVWFYLENWPFQSYLNFTYLDWPVVLWALTASLEENWDPEKASSRFSLALIIIGGVAFIARVTLQVFRNEFYPCKSRDNYVQFA